LKQIVWTDQARADIRALDRQTAMRVLHGLHRFVESGSGDLKALQGEFEELRLRIGDYRLFFVHASDGTIEIRRVRHRKEAYRD
jgi:mRNA-degrading endonuclease RelE of RelBE toxin-antitoxin system